MSFRHLAQFERRLIQERTRAGLAAARSAGPPGWATGAGLPGSPGADGQGALSRIGRMRWGRFARRCISPGLPCIAIWHCRRDSRQRQSGSWGTACLLSAQGVRRTSDRGKDAVALRRLPPPDLVLTPVTNTLRYLSGRKETFARSNQKRNNRKRMRSAASPFNAAHSRRRFGSGTRSE